MKMFRLLTGLMTLALLGVTGCGNGSPDFSPQLSGIAITYTAIAPAPAASTDPAHPTTYAVGDQLQFKATGICTTPPGSSASSQPCPDINVGTVTWSVDTNGTITPDGVLTVTGPTGVGATGQINVTGTVTGLGGSSTPVNTKATVPVTSAVLRTLTISPTAPMVAQGGTQLFTLTGTNSDGTTANLSNYTINWTTSTPGVATLASATGSTNTAKAIAGSGTSTITASTTNANNDPVVTDPPAVLTASGATLQSLSGINLTPATAVIAVGKTQGYQLMGIYSDGVTRQVPNAQINWTVDHSGIASIAATTGGFGETATGVTVGLATITATLNTAASSALTDPTKNTASGTVTVVDAFCTTPLTAVQAPPAPVATVATSVSGGICIGCSVDNAGNVIDSDPTNFALLNPIVNLLGGNLSLTVNSNNTSATPAVPVFGAGSTAGFVIGRPAAALLSADVLTELTITTYLAGAPQESVSESSSTLLPPLLRATLLGLLGSNQQALFSITTTKPYDAVGITYNGGVAAVLSTTQVYGACANIDLTKVPN